MSYSVADFGRMTIDSVRRETYLSALDQLVDPSTRVLDLGCGTGFFTLAALSRGAAHVTAVEILNAVRGLPATIKANGYQDRTSVYQDDIRNLDLDKFDLIISDIRGATPLYGDNLDVLSYARTNLLADGGTLLPAKDTVHCALASVPDWYQRRTEPWHLDEHDWSHFENIVLSSPYRFDKFEPDWVVSDSFSWGEIDYSSPLSLESRRFGRTSELKVNSGTELHGIVAWFDTDTFDGGGYSTQPSDQRPTYGNMLFPFPRPLKVEVNQQLSTSLEAFKSGKQWVWQWEVESQTESMKSSSLDGLPIDLTGLQATRPVGSDQASGSMPSVEIEGKQ